MEEGRTFIDIKGVAQYEQAFWKYQLAVIDIHGSLHDWQEFPSPVESDGLLARLSFEPLTQTFGEGWYIIRLTVILSDGNRPPIAFQEGCHVRIYLPPYR